MIFFFLPSKRNIEHSFKKKKYSFQLEIAEMQRILDKENHALYMRIKQET